MSDFVFLQKHQAEGVPLTELAATVKAFLQNVPPIDSPCAMYHYSGVWGELVVREGHYHGFSPYESSRYLAVVSGGPVLQFADNRFLSEAASSIGTQYILERWQAGKLQPDVDLDGPFAILVVDKQSGELTCITDLMLFVPVFAHASSDGVVVGSHIDVIGHATQALSVGGVDAKVPGTGTLCIHGLDQVSAADFILHGAVTYPHTIYNNVWQLAPASEVTLPVKPFSMADDGSEPFAAYATPYWLPAERTDFVSLNEAADFVRDGIEGYVQTVTHALSGQSVAQFLSAGEDSRVLAGMLTSALERADNAHKHDAYVFTDSYNKEVKIAEKAASLYGARFHRVTRNPMHYFAILPEATRLTGSQFQYHHSHPFQVQPSAELLSYGAVFGGFSADVLLKGQYAPKSKRREQLRFLSQKQVAGERHSRAISSSLFSTETCAEITRRRKRHIQRVERLRSESVHEWFSIWPATMRKALPNLIANRRLFRSYEPFVANAAVKVAASTPIHWRLNRRLFHMAFKHTLRQSRSLRHSDGRLPYWPWWANIPGYTLESYRRAWRRRFNKQAAPEGPWCNWKRLRKHSEWQLRLEDAERKALQLGLVDSGGFITEGHEQQLNLMQLIAVFDSKGNN